MTGDYDCRECGNMYSPNFIEQHVLERHKAPHHVPYWCRMCSKRSRFMTRDQARCHSVTVHHTDVDTCMGGMLEDGEWQRDIAPYVRLHEDQVADACKRKPASMSKSSRPWRPTGTSESSRPTKRADTSETSRRRKPASTSQTDTHGQNIIEIMIAETDELQKSLAAERNKNYKHSVSSEKRPSSASSSDTNDELADDQHMSESGLSTVRRSDEDTDEVGEAGASVEADGEVEKAGGRVEQAGGEAGAGGEVEQAGGEAEVSVEKAGGEAEASVEKPGGEVEKAGGGVEQAGGEAEVRVEKPGEEAGGEVENAGGGVEQAGGEGEAGGEVENAGGGVEQAGGDAEVGGEAGGEVEKAGGDAEEASVEQAGGEAEASVEKLGVEKVINVTSSCHEVMINTIAIMVEMEVILTRQNEGHMCFVYDALRRAREDRVKRPHNEEDGQRHKKVKADTAYIHSLGPR